MPTSRPIHPTVVAALAVAAASALAAVPAEAAAKRAFVTSVTGNGNLSSWPEAHGLTGLAAADEICRTLAGNANLPNPEQFVAWLSDATHDAYCRLHGLAGQRSTNCGQSSLPANAGPWARTDGQRFAGSIAELAAGVVFNAPSRDELGNPVVPSLSYTDTFPDGSRNPVYSGSCSNWTANAFIVTGIGSTAQATGSWTAAGGGYCDGSHHLVCLQGGGAGLALPTPLGGGRLAFVTSVYGTGELGSWPGAGGLAGITAGDEVCQSLAQAAALPHADTFVAWLSDDLAGENAVDRYDFDGPLVRPDGTRVAAHFGDLTDGTLHSPIHQSETGAYIGNWGVWTGTDTDGNAGGVDCQSWNSGSGGQTGGFGVANATSSIWTAYIDNACDFAAARLYCLGDYPDPTIFADGFESGGTTAWSLAVP